jgi:hypothetical protein
MLWVNHESYFGPDRRRRPGGMRVRERRRYEYAGNPPPLPTALRQLRMRVLDAHGQGAAVFSDRARSVAMLAQLQGQTAAASALSSLAVAALRGRTSDIRPELYTSLDRVHAALREG